MIALHTNLSHALNQNSGHVLHKIQVMLYTETRSEHSDYHAAGQYYGAL